MDKQEDKNAQAAERFYEITAATGYTTQEIIDAVTTLAPYIDAGLQAAMGDDSLWRLREELYRETPVLGWFRWYRQLRVWNIRRQIKR